MTGPLRPLKEVTITRHNWYRGHGSRSSRLLITDEAKYEGHMCCLGHVSRACGIKKVDLEDVTAPGNIAVEEMPNAMAGLIDKLGRNSLVCKDMMAINDDRLLSDEVRERNLQARALTIGLSLTFVD